MLIENFHIFVSFFLEKLRMIDHCPSIPTYPHIPTPLQAHTQTRTQTHTHTHTHAHAHAHKHTHTCTHTHMHTCTHMHTYTCTHAHAHIHTHTHTHAHRKICTCIYTKNVPCVPVLSIFLFEPQFEFKLIMYFIYMLIFDYIFNNNGFLNLFSDGD